MENKNYLIRGIIKKLNIRFSLIDTTTAVNDGIILHSCTPISAVLFGKALTVAGLMTPLLGDNEKLSIKWEYSGPVSTILVDADDNCRLRGIPGNPALINEASSEDELYGDTGKITVMKFKDSQILNSGTAEAAMMEISEDISYYMSTSDQIETDFYIAFELNNTPAEPAETFCGLMIQEMPGCSLPEFDKLRNRLHSPQTVDLLTDNSISCTEKLIKILNLITEQNIPYEDFISQYELTFNKTASPVYFCGCSFEKMKNAVLTLKKEEILNIIEEEGEVKTSCKFCRKTYSFTKDDFDF
jgi:molecular chaperone Hsp33